MCSIEQQLRRFYPDLVTLAEGIIKCRNEVPAFYETLYLGCDFSTGMHLVIPCHNGSDDAFAIQCIRAAFVFQLDHPGLPCKCPLAVASAYNFDNVMLVESGWHGYFKGFLDECRGSLMLGVPCHNCEFSGDETSSDFRYIWMRSLPREWSRKPFPKIRISIYNPSTEVLLDSSTGILARPVDLQVEIDAIEGVSSGVLRVENYQHRWCEIRSPHPDDYEIKIAGVLFRGSKQNITSILMSFLDDSR